ncbi:DNA repair exonuclease [Paenibacillus glucanolyticus]|jgi:exonuclease SbcD|uniref:metallophosphoesterase family protein n=1 Tax=Paenibacillus TaxID=44249 RepID=UPI0003E2B849|nr:MULTISPECIES: DNA repair exonuclease [Paenibacillus]ANA78641.1 metallophosphoesterase [Paenibacillus glucanolyticus]AVV57444.1 DNA repair exonuclease [Paenibacillus glucanolyticus]ETT34878.1 metallophosphoesterase [Paenibacillus sp. FSL R5-808]MPY16934.1 DNA repair exonuclease [Paenibacillus glucanolyticus]
MASFRFIHTADLHLDSPFIGISGLDDSLRSFVQDSTFRALDQLVRLAMDQQVDFIVISGDIYDSSNISLRAQLRFMEALERLGKEGIAVYAIHGNHDPLDSTKLSMTLPSHVHVFGGEPASVTAVRRSDREEVAVITGMSYPTSKVTDNIAIRYPAPTSGLYQIGLLHANVDGDPQHETYAPCSKKDLIHAGFHYWALGHIHSRRTLQESPYIVYPGNIQGRHVRETGPKGCYVVDVDEDFNTKLCFHELDSMRWNVVEAPIDSTQDVDAWRLSLERILTHTSRENPEQLSMIRVRITGRSPVHRQLESGSVLDELLADLRRREAAKGRMSGYRGCVWIESFTLQSGNAIDTERLLQEDSFAGDLLRLARQEQGRLHEPDGVAARSVEPLLEHAEIRSLLDDTSPEEMLDWLRRAEELTLGLLLRDRSQGEGAGA